MKVAVLLENNFDESQVITIVDILKRHEIRVDLFGPKIGYIKGKHKIEIYVANKENDSYEEYDCLIASQKIEHPFMVVLDASKSANAYSIAFDICRKLGKNPDYVADRLCFKEAKGK